ncbi:MAG: DUF1353 domain-containing protein [Arenicella sp.]
MSQFTNPLVVSPMNDGKFWVIREAFQYDLGSEGSGNSIVVPVGFVTDFTSVPVGFRFLIPKWGRYGKAAVIHDWLYWDQPAGMFQEQADEIMLEAMQVLQVSPLKEWFIHNAVKWFGHYAWEKNTFLKQQGENRVLPEDKIEKSIGLSNTQIHKKKVGVRVYEYLKNMKQQQNI